MRPSAASLASAVIAPLPTCRSMFLPISAARLLQRLRLGVEQHHVQAGQRAQTWAMPLPIWPAPTMPTRSIAGLLAAARSGGRAHARSSSACKFRQGREQIGHQAVIGHLEDRRLLVLVDGDDDLAVLHAGQMLDRAGNADRDIQVGRHDLAGLADLVVVRHEARIHRRARGADGGAQLVGDRVEQLEILAVLHAAPAGDHHARRGQFRPLAARQLGRDEARQAGSVAAGRMASIGRCRPRSRRPDRSSRRAR